jgi:outer membrane protein OmpA-like peptidoglycan-associated protein
MPKLPARVARRRCIGGLLVVVALGACTTPPADRVILLPGEGSRPSGAVTVRTASADIVIDRPYRQANVDRKGAVEVNEVTAQQVQERFAPLLATRPPRPREWTVYFETGSQQLTASSQGVLEEVRTALAAYPGGELVVTGHTDRVGSVADNDRLSLERASRLRDQLIAAGFDAERIRVAGRGERAPLVPTADEVAEPRNRRAEIKLR